MDTAVNDMLGALEFPSLMPFERRKARMLLKEGLVIVERLADNKNHKVQVILSKTKAKPFRNSARRMLGVFIDGVKRVGKRADGGETEVLFSLIYPSRG